jgi:hypothetical protein
VSDWQPVVAVVFATGASMYVVEELHQFASLMLVKSRTGSARGWPIESRETAAPQ